MNDIEIEIWNFVDQNPGCKARDIIDAAITTPEETAIWLCFMITAGNLILDDQRRLTVGDLPKENLYDS